MFDIDAALDRESLRHHGADDGHKLSPRRHNPRAVSHIGRREGASRKAADTIELPSFDRAVASYYDRWDRAAPEDNDICEAQQRGLSFTGRPPGRFAASEVAVHALDNWVFDQVLS